MDTILSLAQNQSTGTSSMETLLWIASVVGMWKMFEKAGQDGWPALIPFYNYYKLCEITMGNPWYWLRLFVFVVPVVGWIAGIYFLYQMCKAIAAAYGRPESWTFGYMLLSPVFYCLTGFGDASYYGPMGVGDTRTGAARGATTVKFDVEKNEPEREVRTNNDVKVEPVKPESEDVDFFMDDEIVE